MTTNDLTHPEGEEPALTSDNAPALMKIVSVSTALAFGCAVASVEALRFSDGGFSFKFSAGTVAAFVLGAVVGFIFWRLAAKGRRGVWKGSLLMLVMGVGLFFYPMRFVPASVLPQVVIGFVGAVCALSVLGFLVWRVKRFLDADSQQTGE
jgi:hypothetical protein